MNVEIGTGGMQFFFWEYLFQIFCIGSLQWIWSGPQIFNATFDKFRIRDLICSCIHRRQGDLRSLRWPVRRGTGGRRGGGAPPPLLPGEEATAAAATPALPGAAPPHHHALRRYGQVGQTEATQNQVNTQLGLLSTVRFVPVPLYDSSLMHLRRASLWVFSTTKTFLS